MFYKKNGLPDLDNQANRMISWFNELKKLTTAGTELKHYELLTFTNGKMILIELTQERANGEYRIEDVKEVPDEIKSLLK